MSKPSEKILYECRTKCPWCSKLIRAKVLRTTISPGVKAETETTEVVEKDSQTTLEQDYTDEYSPPKKKVKRKAY
jgi:hypothetical protein